MVWPRPAGGEQPCVGVSLGFSSHYLDMSLVREFHAPVGCKNGGG